MSKTTSASSQLRSYRGVVVQGRGYGASRMKSGVVREATRRLVGIDLAPGTLNVRLLRPFDGRLEGYVTEEEIGSVVWSDFIPERKGLRFAEVVIERRFRGVIFQGDEPEYPLDQVEIMSDHHLRTILGLKDGDTVEFALVSRDG